MSSAKGQEIVVFLCPNPDCKSPKLNAPKSMAGKPGKCPHCGSKFRIPEDEDEEEEEKLPEFPIDTGTSSEKPSGSSPKMPVPAGQLVDSIEEEELDEFPEEVELLDEFESLEPLAGSDMINPIEEVPLSERHPLAVIFTRFWKERDEDQIVELYLGAGELISPEYFAESLSQRDYAVFAISGGDTSTMITIPWSSVTRVGIRKVKKLKPIFSKR